jgi:outer membrane protein OmpA-like peptidoglycan-associated protein/predicted small lipoprotein YifL
MLQLLLVSVLILVTLTHCGKKPRSLPPTTTAPPAVDPSVSSDSPTADPTYPLPELDLRIEPERIAKGESALLTWESRNAERVRIEPAIGRVDVSGRIKFFPEESTTYMLYAEGPGGEINRSVEVIVEDLSDQGLREEDLRHLPIDDQFNTFVRPVFFEFDSASLNEQAKLTLDGNIRWLRSEEHSGLEFVIEGHADGRGSEEYNFALGDKRAHTVLEYLAASGIDSSRMQSISLGEEKPFDQGSTEESYALNRRAHFVLLRSP